MEDIRQVSVIAGEFNATIRTLIAKLEKKSRSDLEIANLDRLKKRIQLLKTTMGPAALVDAAAPFFIKYSEQILSRDEDFFNQMDVRGELIKRKNQVDKDDEFTLSLIDSIRTHYNKSPQLEKDEVYTAVRNLFNNSVEYQLSNC